MTTRQLQNTRHERTQSEKSAEHLAGQPSSEQTASGHLSDETLEAAGRDPAELARLYGKVGIAAVAAACRYHNKSKIEGGKASRRSVHAA